MNMIRQIGVEFKNLLRTKFIFIIGILVLLIGIAFPVISFGFERFEQDNVYYGYGNEYAVTESGYVAETYNYNGVEITQENPFYGEITYYSQEINEMMGPEIEISDYSRSVFDQLRGAYVDFFSMYASEITSYEDYRTDIVYQANNRVFEQFVLGSKVENKEEFKEAVQMIGGSSNLDELLALSDEEKAVKMEENQAFLDQVEEAVFQDNLDTYIDCMIELEQLNIESYKKSIEAQEAAVIENPELEEGANKEIERLEEQIYMTQETVIPNWEYRKEKQLNPSAEDWRNDALNSVQSYNYRLSDAQKPMTEEEFSKDYYNKEEYGDYKGYLEAMDRQVEEAKENIAVAENSLAADKPDMKFEREKARYMVNSNLFYALVVAFFGILLGGYIIANEFQSGTIRLLMIRPRTRVKVYTAKFFAGLALSYVIYFLGMILNIIVNGIFWGFGDYLNPNFTATGPVGFWPMMIGRILACSVTIVLSYAFAYGLSALIKNSAIAIALPGACIFGSVIASSILAYTRFAKYLAYTPLPYINFAGVYSEYGVISRLEDLGMTANAVIGISMLLCLAVICFVVGLLHFKNHDITN